MSAAVEFAVTHTEASAGRAVRALWNSRNRRAWWTSMAVAVALMTVALATRELPWYLAIPLTAVILHAAFLAWHRDHVLGVMKKELQRAQPPVFRYRLDDAGVAEESAVGRAELPWSAFAGLRELDGFLFLLRTPLASGLFIALPAAEVPQAAQAVLRERLPVV